MDLIATLASELNLRPEAVEAAVKLIDEGNTIPFIARYRNGRAAVAGERGNLEERPSRSRHNASQLVSGRRAEVDFVTQRGTECLAWICLCMREHDSFA
ncbi:hypothetical protein H6A07_03035 [Olsenella uli]|nr:hypothetical protein [Olsenella uli]